MPANFLKPATIGALLFLAASLAGAELRRDIEYGRAGGEPLLLDASVPEGAGPFPVAVLVHGGGWSNGDKAGSDKPGNGADVTPWFAPLTTANFAWFSINYRLAPRHRWPACFEDVQTAIRWVKAHAAEFKGDPQRIVLFGHSAGGHLVCFAATLAGEDTRVQAVVGYAPVTDFEYELPARGGLSKSLQDLHDRPKEVTPESLAILRETAPINHVKPGLPPFLLVHGDADKSVPYPTSLNFQARLRANGVPCELITIPGGPHGLLTWPQFAPDYADRMIAWLRQTLVASPPSVPTTAAPAIETANPLCLWYRQPAGEWVEALPLGNGRLGAMVFGGPAREHIQFNEDTIWTGQPHEYQREGAAKFLPELRRLLAAGRQAEAHELGLKEFMSVPLRQMAYQPCGDLWLDFPGHEAATDYRRSLDLDPAVATVRYRVGDTTFTREIFASYPDQVIVIRLTADRPGQISLTAKLSSPHAGASGRNFSEPLPGLAVGGQVQENGIKFEARVHVAAQGGTVTAGDGSVGVEKADAVTLQLDARTNFQDFQHLGASPSARVAAELEAVRDKPYARLRADHVADHQRLFRRVTLDLGASPAGALPTDVRLRAADKTGDPALPALYFQFGRYLLIASSRPGGQPANLQGLWNDRLSPSWGSKYTVNINTEMNYWPAEVTNLAECAEPLYAMIDDLLVSGRKTAQAHYGVRGWVLHHNTDLWRGTAPINHSNHGIWPSGGAWLTRQLWEHYLFGGDRDFLARRAYPVMKEAALFFIDYLVRDPKSDWLVSGPSNSPEQGGLVMGPTMDHQIIRALFAATAEAAGVLGVDADFAAQLRDLHARLAPNRIGRHGQLQEWLEDVDDPANTHRHVSHLWGVFPGNEITPQTPVLFQAAQQSLRFRGDDGTGWSLAWKICLWARFLDGDHAHRMILRQLQWVDPHEPSNSSHGGTYPNLFDAHPPFQIDGNFGAAAGIAEMLVQSQAPATAAGEGGEIVLLPALPKAWPAGRVTGLRARGGFEVDIAWRDGSLRQAELRSGVGGAIRLRAGSQVRLVSLAPGERRTFGPDLQATGPFSR